MHLGRCLAAMGQREPRLGTWDQREWGVSSERVSPPRPAPAPLARWIEKCVVFSLPEPRTRGFQQPPHCSDLWHLLLSSPAPSTWRLWAWAEAWGLGVP